MQIGAGGMNGDGGWTMVNDEWWMQVKMWANEGDALVRAVALKLICAGYVES